MDFDATECPAWKAQGECTGTNKDFVTKRCCQTCSAVIVPYAAQAVFSMSGVSGVISFSQATALSPTMLRISLAGLNGQAQQFHVHVSPTQQSSSDPCGPAATGGHFNPLNVPAGACTPMTPNLCEVGDLSGKHGELLNLLTADWTKYDSYLPLSGTNSIIGRSVVIHKPDGSRWVCADISGGAVATSSPVASLAPIAIVPVTALPSINPPTLPPNSPSPPIVPVADTAAPMSSNAAVLDSPAGPSGGAIAGIVIGVILGLLLILFVVAAVLHKTGKKEIPPLNAIPCLKSGGSGAKK